MENGNHHDPERMWSWSSPDLRRRTFIDQLIEEKEEASVPEPKRSTFSIRMNETDQVLLQNLADYFGWKKTPLAEVLLTEALNEAGRRLALHEANGDEEEAREIYLALLQPPIMTPEEARAEGEVG